MEPQHQSTPHIWWCPTGPLTFLPIHAAGPYNKSGPDIMQRVISSYTPTLMALARARDRCPPNPAKMLAIGVTQTPYQSALCPLPSVKPEIESVSAIAISQQIPLHTVHDSDATVEKVISSLKEFNVVHFACHAHQDQSTPMDSVLYLGDGPLLLSRIASLRLTDVETAFLSACRTAGGSDILPEEAMHIAAGMQMAGYRSVVATMWTMPDSVGPTLVREFYGRVLQGSDVDASRVAGALREAVLVLRKDKNVPLAAWATFVSMGI
jgi:CHAT domain-containing protein